MNARFRSSAWSAVSAIALVVVLSGTTALGATLTFNATAGTTWNGTNTNWNTSGGSPTTWNSLTPDYAIISGTGTTITVGSGIVASGIDFTGNNFVLDATSSGFGFGSGSNQLRLAGNNWAATINGAISSNGSMHVQAIHTGTPGFNPPPQINFGGTSTGGWQGATTITRGVAVSLQGDNQALNSTSGITLNGGMIELINTSATAITNNRINDGAPITVTGGGGFRIANTNTADQVYSENIGDVTLNSGYLAFSYTTNLNTANTTQTLTLNSFTRNNQSVVYFGPSANSAGIIKVTGAAQTAPNEIIGPWALSGNGNTIDDYAVFNASGQVVNRNATANNTETTWSTSWSATANQYLNNVGGVNLTANRTFNTFRIRNTTNNTWSIGDFTFATYGFLSNGNQFINAGNGSITIPTDNGDSALYLANGNGAITMNATIKDNGSTKLTLVLTGSSSAITLNGDSSYTGGTVIARSMVRNSATSGGSNIEIGHANAFGASTNYLKFDSGILDLNAINLTVGEFSGEASSYITASAGGTLTVGNGTSSTSSTEFKGLITAGQIVKNGSGRLTLSGINTASATTAQYTVNGGTLQFAKTQSFHNSTTGSWTAAKNVVGNGGTLAFNVGGTDEFGTGNVTTLLTNLGGANGNSTAGFAAGSAIGFDTTNAAGGSFTIANLIANSTGTGGGNIGLTKFGTGTLILIGNNTYDGPTTVAGGTLLVNGDQSGATGLFNIASGAAVGGSGTLGANLTISAGADLNLTGATLGSNSTGILTLADTATLSLGNMTFQDLVGWDWLNASEGTYKLIAGNFTVNFGSTQYVSPGTAYDFGNGKSGYFTQGSLNVVVVPEPATMALPGVGVVLLGLRLARRRS